MILYEVKNAALSLRQRISSMLINTEKQVLTWMLNIFSNNNCDIVKSFV